MAMCAVRFQRLPKLHVQSKRDTYCSSSRH
nr:MAG TPA: hypothetical protein [Caudoviricetes sp.]